MQTIANTQSSEHAFSTILSILSAPSDLENLSSKIIHRDINLLVESIRHHLNMDVAFLSRFKNGFREITQINKREGCQINIAAGQKDCEEVTYCKLIADNKLPSLIPNTRENSVTAEMPITEHLTIGSYIGVPILLSDGSCYGTLCCFNEQPDETLSERDLSILTLFSSFAARNLEKDLQRKRMHKQIRKEVSSMIRSNALSSVFQPIYDNQQKKIVGFECLTRFNIEPYRTPDYWFNRASQAGFGELLELYAIEIALASFDKVPDDCFITLNISPKFVGSPKLKELLKDQPLHRIVLEVTEREPIDDYNQFRNDLKPFRERGLRLAVDDAGAGYASFQHILELSADIIKLDRSLICNVNQDLGRRALSAALIGFANETNCLVLGEGVETQAEMDTLNNLGARYLQGYYLSHPLSLQQAVDFYHHTNEQQTSAIYQR
ncbi:MAG: EAL domain-containing protein [Marinomonas atlantica]|nr:EAL domain-containing protein [Marinomonas atlantica]